MGTTEAPTSSSHSLLFQCPLFLTVLGSNDAAQVAALMTVPGGGRSGAIQIQGLVASSGVAAAATLLNSRQQSGEEGGGSSSGGGSGGGGGKAPKMGSGGGGGNGGSGTGKAGRQKTAGNVEGFELCAHKTFHRYVVR